MLNRAKLTLLTQAVERGDWTRAADVCLELSIEAKGTPDEFLVVALPPAVRSQDAEWLAVIIKELTASASPDHADM